MLMTTDQTRVHSRIDDFVESLTDRNLTFYASDLMKLEGCQSMDELQDALKRTTEVCTCMHLPLQENFKAVFRSAGSEVVQDWRLSPLAYMLLVINSDSSKDVVAKVQVELVRRMLNL